MPTSLAARAHLESPGLPDLDGRHVSPSLVRFLFDSVARIGGDTVRMPGASARQQAGGAGAAIPRTDIAPAYKAAMMELQNHVCAAEGKVPVSYDEFDMLCYCIIGCRTLGEALGRAQRFFAMLETRGVSIEVREDGPHAAFLMHTNRRRNTLPTFLLDLSGLAYFYQLFSWLIGQPLPLVETCMAYEKPLAQRSIVASIFSHPIQFDRSANKLMFPTSCLDRPIARTYRDLEARLGEVSFDLMPSQWASARLSDQLRATFQSALARRATLPTLAQAARALNQSVATLRRRLAEDQTSARSIREACLLEASVDYMKDPRLTIEEISARLCFSSPSSFRRAFRQWTGQSPSTYRAAHFDAREDKRPRSGI